MTERRTILRRGLLAGTLLTGTAGCLGLGSDGTGTTNSRDRTGTTDSSEATTAGDDDADVGNQGDAWSWFPSPSAIRLESYEPLRVDPGPFRDHREALSSDAYFPLSGRWHPPGIVGIDGADVAELFSGSGFWIYLGDYDRSEAEAIAAEAPTDYETTDHESGFTIYSADGIPQGHALGDRGAIFVQRTERGVDEGNLIEAILDSRFGDGSSYTDANPELDPLFDALGAAPYVQADAHERRTQTIPERGRFAGSVGWGVAATPGPEETSVTWAVAFTAADAVEPPSVRTWADASLTDSEVRSIATSGSVVTVETTVPTGQFRLHEDLPGS